VAGQERGDRDVRDRLLEDLGLDVEGLAVALPGDGLAGLAVDAGRDHGLVRADRAELHEPALVGGILVGHIGGEPEGAKPVVRALVARTPVDEAGVREQQPRGGDGLGRVAVHVRPPVRGLAGERAHVVLGTEVVGAVSLARGPGLPAVVARPLALRVVAIDREHGPLAVDECLDCLLVRHAVPCGRASRLAEYPCGRSLARRAEIGEAGAGAESRMSPAPAVMVPVPAAGGTPAESY